MTMELAYHDRPPFNPAFLPHLTDRQNQSGHPMDHTQAFYPMGGAFGSSTCEVYDERQTYPGYGMTTAETSNDAAKGPRLTQEQLAQLEDEFAQNFKPNTEHKKTLAERMGVEFSKVNNWFQNRRAKAKQECQAQQRSETSHQEPVPHFTPESLEYKRSSDSRDSTQFSAPEHVPNMSVPIIDPLSFTDYLHEVPHVHQYSDAPLDQHHSTSPLKLDPSAPAGCAFSQYPANSICDDFKVPTASVREISSQETLSAPAFPASCIDLGRGIIDYHPPPIYSHLDSNMAGNPSLQSLGTSPSEDGEKTKYITPPLEPSSLPGLNQSTFQHDRQASNSSDLADNLTTVHLQQSRSNLSVNPNFDTGPTSNFDASTGLPTPEISPDTMAPKLPFENKNDIASRRKRPRPAALKPQPNRSISYAGPMTSSPRYRLSPPGSGKMSPVRRIKSTGNNLNNVTTGRVKKSGVTPVQISPRNFEGCFRVASMPESQQHSEQQNSSHENLGDYGNSPFPVFDATAMPVSTPCTLPPSTHEHGFASNVPFAHSSTNLLDQEWSHSQVGYTNFPFGIVPAASNSFRQGPFHCPPQSAPAHCSTFDSAMALTAQNMGAGFPVSANQHEPYPNDFRHSTPLRSNLLPYHLSGDPSNHLQPSFSAVPPHHFPSIGLCMPYPSFTNRTPTPPSKPLEIRIEMIPSPPKEMAQVSHEPKEYTFENSFSGDAHFATGSKK